VILADNAGEIFLIEHEGARLSFARKETRLCFERREKEGEREKEKERPALRLIRIFAACFRPSRTHRNFIVIALNFSSNSFDLFRAPFVIVFCDENNAHLDFFGLGKSFCVYLRSNYLILFDGRKFL
jgi:hypothetical protein